MQLEKQPHTSNNNNMNNGPFINNPTYEYSAPCKNKTIIIEKENRIMKIKSVKKGYQ